MEFQKGQTLSEIQFYKVENVTKTGLELITDSGQSINVSLGYANDFLQSAHNVDTIVKVGKTELANLFISSNRIALTVCFYKQVKESDIVTELLKSITESSINNLPNAVKASVKKAMNGEERIMIGRHYGEIDEFGRIKFIDMEVVKDETKDYDNRARLVDPRTIQWMIVNNVKYILK